MVLPTQFVLHSLRLTACAKWGPQVVCSQIDTRWWLMVKRARTLPVRVGCAPRHRLLALAEGRLAHTDSRARDGEAEAEGLRRQLAGALEALRGAGGEGEALREELRAVSEDLEALVRENQVGPMVLWCSGGRGPHQDVAHRLDAATHAVSPRPTCPSPPSFTCPRWSAASWPRWRPSGTRRWRRPGGWASGLRRRSSCCAPRRRRRRTCARCTRRWRWSTGGGARLGPGLRLLGAGPADRPWHDVHGTTVMQLLTGNKHLQRVPWAGVLHRLAAARGCVLAIARWSWSRKQVPAQQQYERVPYPPRNPSLHDGRLQSGYGALEREGAMRETALQVGREQRT